LIRTETILRTTAIISYYCGDRVTSLNTLAKIKLV
jgi:hypothetical protein